MPSSNGDIWQSLPWDLYLQKYMYTQFWYGMVQNDKTYDMVLHIVLQWPS